jgi:hypothetical protein
MTLHTVIFFSFANVGRIEKCLKQQLFVMRSTLYVMYGDFLHHETS